MATVPPARTWLYDSPSAKGGMLHCPSECISAASNSLAITSEKHCLKIKDPKIFMSEMLEMVA